LDSYQDGIFEDGMLAILPVLARLCWGDVLIADGSGRHVRRVNRDGTVSPERESQASAILRAVSRSGRAEWERDETTGTVRVAFPVGDRIVEITQTGDSFDTMRTTLPKAGTLGRVFSEAAERKPGGAARPVGAGGFSAKYNWHDIVGDGPAITRALAQARAASRGVAPVFLIGESGTGKELFAQAIHNASARRSGPFVAINCSTLPESLADSMLFGYMDGTFTGARKGGSPGLFEQASGGTLLLDEVTEINVETQAKLLRVIQEREVCRIGSVKPIPLDIRIVATSNRDLHRHMREGHFREDLYYRLNVIDIHLPPLRDRPEDIPAIVNRMIDGMAESEDHYIRKIRSDAMDWLVAQPWPGNVRQLRNVLERAVSLAEGDVLLAQHFARTDAVLCPGANAVHRTAGEMIVSSHLSDRVAHAEETSILDALQRNNGHRGKTAAELGISVTTLWRRLRRIGHAPTVN
jgi:transcriptional regulator with PAS, ATPase and Fis domain